MAKLVWGDIGQRFFESGVDRGVLYPKVGPGVVWNGITAVSEKTDGGQPRPFYADGFKYLNLSSAEDFAASITALSTPAEFAMMDGMQRLLNGLYITQQKREPFGFSYRTKVGNDSDGPDHAYKIHLVYNALASATNRDYRTLDSSSSPMSLTWEITTIAPPITGYRPSAHFVIDARNTPTGILDTIEGMLYGTASTDPYLPTVTELINLFNA